MNTVGTYVCNVSQTFRYYRLPTEYDEMYNFFVIAVLLKHAKRLPLDICCKVTM